MYEKSKIILHILNLILIYVILYIVQFKFFLNFNLILIHTI